MSKEYTPIERIEFILNKEDLTYNKLATLIDRRTQTLYNIRDGKTKDISPDLANKISEVFPIYSNEWLRIGVGSPYASSYNKVFHPKFTECIQTDQEVILYDVAAAANLSTLFCNRDQNILGKISIPDMPKCDGAVYVTGDSMYPLLKSGDIVIYKEINEYYNIIFGEMYLISFDLEGDEYLTVKYINKGSDSEHVKLISYNEHFSPMEIPINAIRALAIVKMSIRKNTML